MEAKRGHPETSNRDLKLKTIGAMTKHMFALHWRLALRNPNEAQVYKSNVFSLKSPPICIRLYFHWNVTTTAFTDFEVEVVDFGPDVVLPIKASYTLTLPPEIPRMRPMSNECRLIEMQHRNYCQFNYSNSHPIRNAANMLNAAQSASSAQSARLLVGSHVTSRCKGSIYEGSASLRYENWFAIPSVFLQSEDEVSIQNRLTSDDLNETGSDFEPTPFMLSIRVNLNITTMKNFDAPKEEWSLESAPAANVLAVCSYLEFSDSAEFSDVRIVVHGRTFHAHKVILSAQSIVFRQMFNTPLSESHENLVNIVDTTASIFEAFLRYIYAHEIDADWLALAEPDIVLGLYRLADKYAVALLKARITEWLCAHVSVDNVLMVLELANLYDETRLKAECFIFIATHREAVFEHADWTDFMLRNPVLVTSIMRTF